MLAGEDLTVSAGLAALHVAQRHLAPHISTESVDWCARNRRCGGRGVISATVDCARPLGAGLKACAEPLRLTTVVCAGGAPMRGAAAIGGGGDGYGGEPVM